MDPLSRYHKISLSRLAYSDRSRTADGDGVLRKFLETNSMMSSVTRGRSERRSRASSETAEGQYYYLYIILTHTIYKRS
jgi:hypothetical protein